MMYQDKMVVAIKHNGRVLREHGDLVKLPFGSEFSILLKNLDSRRAAVRVSIDGTDVLDGNEIILDANSDMELRRFVRNGNMNTGNAFKFIERTQAIEDGPRGIKIEDGIVRVEFWFERPVSQPLNLWKSEPFYGYRPDHGSSYNLDRFTKGAQIGVDFNRDGYTRTLSAVEPDQTFSATSASKTLIMNAQVNDAGITVPGSHVTQTFTPVSGIVKEPQSHVLVLRLAGRTENAEVSKPVTVKTKQKCVTCGKVNKATAKFCGDCGTALELL